MAKLILNKEEDVLVSIQSLEVEEARLVEQKENLTTLLNQLETKANEELKGRKRIIEGLYLEVFELQEKCKKLTHLINEGSTLECSQTTQLEEKDVVAEEPWGVNVLPAVPVVCSR